jgi:uncharacterized phage protein (TIGR01671 family)
MREIKFRAWNKEAEVMHNWDEIGKVLHAKYFDDWIAEGGIELMQYTGLKDKNGKEIYEGDVIRGEDPLDYFLKDITQVVVEWLECGAWYPFACDHDYEPYPKPEHCEVIGNIYENPELLK